MQAWVDAQAAGAQGRAERRRQRAGVGGCAGGRRAGARGAQAAAREAGAGVGARGAGRERAERAAWACGARGLGMPVRAGWACWLVSWASFWCTVHLAQF